jgi:hypothetical protein
MVIASQGTYCATSIRGWLDRRRLSRLALSWSLVIPDELKPKCGRAVT